jgi:glycosyltransferase involved in cell wall biosynthesis
MKIAFLSFYSGEVYRGVETFVHELGNRLVKMGHKVTIYQNGPQIKGAKYKTVTMGLKIDYKKTNSYRPFVNYYGRKVGSFTSKVLKEIDKDTDIIFPTNGQWQALLCGLWAKVHKAKVVISGQSGPGLDDRMNLWTFPDSFTALTRYQKNWARRANPFVRVEKIPNGVDLTKFNNEIKPISLDLPRPVILSVGALDSSKRLDLAIKAVSRLENPSLLLVGRGPQEEELRKLGEELLPKRFKIMHFAYSQMPEVYRAADIFTYPTVPWESFGLALVEAMASGLPVVATNDPIRKEIVGRAGVLVNPTDTAAYSVALENALKLRWGKRPLNQAKRFNWDKIALKYEKLFSELVK